MVAFVQPDEPLPEEESEEKSKAPFPEEEEEEKTEEPKV